MKTKDAIAALGALAQETRLAIFRLLVEAGPQGIPAGLIADKLGVPPPSLSFHLTHLMHAGLITQRRMSRSLFYACDVGRMNGLIQYLTANCCGSEVTCAPACNPAAALSKQRTSRRAS